jgi:N-glycosylase/DNA lyase
VSGCAGVAVAIHLPEAEGIHLARTLESGQAFRWRWERGASGPGAVVGVIGDRVLRILQDERGLWLISPPTDAARRRLRTYLGLVTGPGRLGDVETALARDPALSRVLPHTRGIAVLAQDPWEVLISFIISANNNIPKIRQSIERLARSLGEPLGEGRHAFPTPERLAAAHARTLAACLLGYRAPYVRAAARLVADGRLDLGALRRRPVDEARQALLAVPGVGDKVADCTLLFGLGQTAAFPVDVWVKRAVERLYFRGRARTPGQIRAFAQARFGPISGYAQQHLFAYARAYLGPRSAGPGRFRPGPWRPEPPRPAGPTATD